MRRIVWGMFVLLACESAVGAQGPESESRQGATKNPQEHFAAIVKDQEDASRRYHKAYDDATDDGGRRQAIDRFLREVGRNTNRALDLARENPKDPAAIEALVFVIRTAKAGPGRESAKAVEILARDHVRDEGVGAACDILFILFHLPAAEDLIRAVMERNPSHTERGLACYALARYLKYQSRMIREMRADPVRVRGYEDGVSGEGTVTRLLREKSPDALDEQAVALLGRTIAEYGAVPYGTRTLADIAEGELSELRHLAVGKVAPEIKGRDIDGKVFKLSDFRGKVVVLTFSGKWCGPCRAMYPHEREMVARLKDQPFALLSVNTDESEETLRKSIESGEITWRCWSDGGTDGPITTAWGIQSFPAVYILDRKGVIRFKGVQVEELEKLVGSLLDEGPAEQPSPK